MPSPLYKSIHNHRIEELIMERSQGYADTYYHLLHLRELIDGEG